MYICRCGGNISNTIDIKRVVAHVKSLKDVNVVENNDYLCSATGQTIIKNGIIDHRLNRIVVAACTPRLHLETFKIAVSETGLNSYLLEMVNIREQDSWVHNDIDSATTKAIALIRGAVNRAKHLEELQPHKIPVKDKVLVIGGGIAGIQASLDIAEQGYEVYLMDKKPSIGGHMAQLSKTFPTLDCSLCILAPKLVDVGRHPKIKILTKAELIDVQGPPGDYKVLVQVNPRYVTTGCTYCGDCVKVCPVVVPNEFDEGMTPKRAINLPFIQAIPSVYNIDMDFCIRSDEISCDKCFEVCTPQAIDFEMRPEVVELHVGSIIVATGFELMDPKTIGEYCFGSHPDIVTNLQFERLLFNGICIPSTRMKPKKVAFVLCVGSRMRTMSIGRGVEHCCKIGCMVAIKQAILLLKEIPTAEPSIFYQDIRADGKGHEEFYADARDHNVRFVRGRVAEIVPTKDGVFVRAEDTVLGMPIDEKFDLVVLSPGIIHNSGTDKLSKIIGIHQGSDGFMLERHYKLKPVDSARDGIYLCGCVLGPKDIRETVLEAMSTATRVLSFIGKGEFLASPEIAKILPDKCTLCKECVPVCSFDALVCSDSKMKVHPISCVGCGICVPACPYEAIDLKHCSEEQLIAQIQGVSSGTAFPKIIAFLDKNTAYASIDYAGQLRLSYPSSIRIIAVPSVGRIGLKHLLFAFASGADGVIFVEGEDTPITGDTLRKHMRGLGRELKARGIAPLRIIFTTTTLPQYDKLLKLFEAFNKRISNLKRISSELRQKIKDELKI